MNIQLLVVGGAFLVMGMLAVLRPSTAIGVDIRWRYAIWRLVLRSRAGRMPKVSDRLWLGPLYRIIGLLLIASGALAVWKGLSNR